MKIGMTILAPLIYFSLLVVVVSNFGSANQLIRLLEPTFGPHQSSTTQMGAKMSPQSHLRARSRRLADALRKDVDPLSIGDARARYLGFPAPPKHDAQLERIWEEMFRTGRRYVSRLRPERTPRRV